MKMTHLIYVVCDKFTCMGIPQDRELLEISWGWKKSSISTPQILFQSYRTKSLHTYLSKELFLAFKKKKEITITLIEKHCISRKNNDIHIPSSSSTNSHQCILECTLRKTRYRGPWIPTCHVCTQFECCVAIWLLLGADHLFICLGNGEFGNKKDCEAFG